MCGLAGFLTANPSETPEKSILKPMTDALAHRGPDGEGCYLQPGIALGHRRLAIIDPAGGEQPMFNEDHSCAVVFNGEIYNFEALRQELAALGHVFRNRCDTEAIVHAWEQWGPDCVTRLAGMFAFAIWDNTRKTLFLARDHLGKKPLYYTAYRGGLAFASELSGLFALGGARPALRPTAIEDFFTFGYVPEPDTVFAGIHKLPAAHTMLARHGAPPVLARYWAPPTRITPISEADAVADLMPRLRDSVARRLVSDVPLGAFLSGGVDSSGVVAIAAGLRANALDTFTIGFEGSEDETPFAAQVAARYGTTQHNERAAAPDMIAGARIQARVFGEPFGDPSGVPTLSVCKLARRHATVALSGDGGDEVFAGYRRTRWHMLVSAARRYVPGPVRGTLIAQLAALYPKLDWAPRFLRAKHTLTELSLDDAAGFARISTKVHRAQRRALFSASLRAALDGHDPNAPLAAQFAATEDSDPLLQAQLADLATWLPGDILTKADRASMAASLEMRAPLLDYQLVEWGLGLPASLKIRGAEGKYVLKKALEPLVPAAILYRPKQGFTNDLSRAFRRQAAQLRDILLGGPMLESGLFDPAAIARLIDAHEAGSHDHQQALWLLLCFEGFLFMQHNPAAPDGTPA